MALAGTDTLWRAWYGRDVLGRITQIHENVLGTSKSWIFAYSDTGFLSRVTLDGTVTERYAYDANGNRTRFDGPAAGDSGYYDAQDRLTRYGGTTYAYTAAGELTTRIAGSDTTRYTYDPLGNLIKVQFQSGDVIDYLIDGRNRRVGRKFNGTLTARWLYQDQLEPVAELDASGALVARYVYGTRAHVPDYVVKGGTTYRIVSDHLGSVRLVVNASTGAVAQRMDYDGFGRVTLDTSPGFQAFGYAGGLWDAATALVRFGARDYDAEVGRWTSKDPIGFLGGSPNLFAYVDGNPIDLIDPSGTDVNSDLNSLAGGADALSCGWASKMRDKYFPYNDIDLESAAYAGGVESGKGIVVSLAFGGIGRFAKFLPAVRGASGVGDALKGLRAGSSSRVKLVGSADELEGLFGRLSAGGRPLQGTTYPGRLTQLPDGTRVGIRPTSSSGGPTIDIHPPSGPGWKVHVGGGS